MTPKMLARTIVAALLAGAVAIMVNILILDSFDALGIVTARGGLQKLMRLWLGGPLYKAGVAQAWTAFGLPAADTVLFKNGFKVSVGLLMACAYAVLIEPRLTGTSLRRGLIAAVLFWCLNAFVVLPLLHEGVGGLSTLTPIGMLAYAAAHTAFFAVLSKLLEVFKPLFDRGLGGGKAARARW